MKIELENVNQEILNAEALRSSRKNWATGNWIRTKN